MPINPKFLGGRDLQFPTGDVRCRAKGQGSVALSSPPSVTDIAVDWENTAAPPSPVFVSVFEEGLLSRFPGLNGGGD